jgi:tellurite resistance protein TerC
MDFLFLDWLGKPLWLWLSFLAIVAILLVIDLGVVHRKSKEIGVAESLVTSASISCWASPLAAGSGGTWAPARA